jgi:hypothetical protein
MAQPPHPACMPTKRFLYEHPWLKYSLLFGPGSTVAGFARAKWGKVNDSDAVTMTRLQLLLDTQAVVFDKIQRIGVSNSPHCNHVVNH